MTDIRPATPADVPEIRRIARETWHAAYDGILGQETVAERIDDWYAEEGLESAVREASERDDGTFLVAVADGDETGELVGFAAAGPHPEAGEATAILSRIYVVPEAWGEGTGSALLSRLEADLPDRFDRLRLAVLADNDAGVSFYESTGFERDATRESEVGEDVREYVYEKSL